MNWCFNTQKHIVFTCMKSVWLQHSRAAGAEENFGYYALDIVISKGVSPIIDS